MKEYEIWVGVHDFGQGYFPSTEPQLVAIENSVNFKTACFKYELKTRLDRIEEGEKNGDLNSQDYPWLFNEHTVSNSWLGKYYESREEALKTFK